MRLSAHLDVIVAVVVGFAEDRMMDIITGRAPPPARAESYRSKGSRELARPGPSLVVPTFNKAIVAFPPLCVLRTAY